MKVKELAEMLLSYPHQEDEVFVAINQEGDISYFLYPFKKIRRSQIGTQLLAITKENKEFKSCAPYTLTEKVEREDEELKPND